MSARRRGSSFSTLAMSSSSVNSTLLAKLTESTLKSLRHAKEAINERQQEMHGALSGQIVNVAVKRLFGDRIDTSVDKDCKCMRLYRTVRGHSSRAAS